MERENGKILTIFIHKHQKWNSVLSGMDCNLLVKLTSKYKHDIFATLAIRIWHCSAQREGSSLLSATTYKFFIGSSTILSNFLTFHDFLENLL